MFTLAKVNGDELERNILLVEDEGNPLGASGAVVSVEFKNHG